MATANRARTAAGTTKAKAQPKATVHLNRPDEDEDVNPLRSGLLLERVPRVNLVVGPDGYRNLPELIGHAHRNRANRPGA